MNNQYNDNELLYLITEHDEDAFMELYSKYIPLIKRKILDFRISPKNFDDFFQEGSIILVKALETYKRNSIKTFTKYFELILSRRIIDLLKKESNYYYNVELSDDMDIYFKEEIKVYDEEPLGFLSDMERKIYVKKYHDGLKASAIALELKITPRQVYNSLQRIRRKKHKIN